MGVSYYVIGIKPADEKYNQMKTIYELCESVGVQVPKEVIEFFSGTTPGIRGLETYLSEMEPDPLVITDTSEDDYRLIVDLRKLPDDIKILAFVVSC